MLEHDTREIEKLLTNSFFEFLLKTEDIEKAEQLSMEYVLKRAAVAFGNALSVLDEELSDEVPDSWRIKEYRTRRPIAEFGRIEYTQTVYIDDAGDCRRFLDEIIGMPARVRMTPNLSTMIAENACSTSYSNATDLLSRHCRIKISETTVASLIQEAGNQIKEVLKEQAHNLYVNGEAPPGKVGSGMLLCEADGVWVSTVKRNHKGKTNKTEIKNFIAYVGKHKGRLVGRVCNASVEKPASFWKESIAAAGEVINLSNLKIVALGCDGASWCKAGADYLPGTPQVFLDKWHVYHAINGAISNKDEAARACGILRRQGVAALVAWLELHFADDDKVTSLLRYLRNNVSIINPNVSLGSIEGVNAHVLSERLEAWGCAWSVSGASAMARCRSRRANGEKIPSRRRNAMYSTDHWNRVSSEIAKRVRYHEDCSGEGYEYPHSVETKRMPARQRYLLTRGELSSIPY